MPTVWLAGVVAFRLLRPRRIHSPHPVVFEQLLAAIWTAANTTRRWHSDTRTLFFRLHRRSVPDSSSSVTTHVTRRFAQVDVILLVDNAQQPMQAAPLSVLRAVASSGHHRKLAIAFTHFDQIKGQNFQKFADKRSHVMASVLNALSSLRAVLGVAVVNAIEHGIDSRCFMLGGVDRQLAKLPTRAADYMKGQLSELVGFFQKAILPPPPAEA